MSDGAEELKAIDAQGVVIKELKTAKADKAEIDAAVAKLLEAKAAFKAATGKDHVGAGKGSSRKDKKKDGADESKEGEGGAVAAAPKKKKEKVKGGDPSRWKAKDPAAPKAPKAPKAAKAPKAPKAAAFQGGDFGAAADTASASGLFVRAHDRMKDVVKGDKEGQQVVVKGWVKAFREQSATLIFCQLSDGSTFSGIQVVLTAETEGFEAAKGAGGVAASLTCTGLLEKNPKNGSFEVKAAKVEVMGANLDPDKYAVGKQRLSMEKLRELAHLRPRTNTMGAVMRVRNAMAYATHKFFNENGFFYIHTPLITASDCEGAGEMFQVTTLLDKHPDGKLPAVEEKDATAHAPAGSVDYNGDFFGKKAYLTVSGQLNVETHACALGDVYTFGPTFRAEDSHTSRHLAEFWMIEPEISFADLDADMALAEAYVKYCTRFALENCADDIAFFDQMIEKGLVERLQNVIAAPFAIVTYTEVIELLNQPEHMAAGAFEEKPDWGIDLGSEHERYLAEKIHGKPTIITHYPKEIKAFYMRADEEVQDLSKYEGTHIGVAPDRSGVTVAAMDVIVPRIGELIGGSQREERPDVLDAAIKANGDDPKDYWWYCDLRKYGTTPHSGFGLGFERLIMFVTGIENIRDTIPFPRVPRRCDF
jgi:asparaginyl-tRNA synthetase